MWVSIIFEQGLFYLTDIQEQLDPIYYFFYSVQGGAINLLCTLMQFYPSSVQRYYDNVRSLYRLPYYYSSIL